MLLGRTIGHLFKPKPSNRHRSGLLHPTSVLSLAFIALGFFSALTILGHTPLPQAKILGFASSITPAQVVAQTNQQRASAGLSPLTLNPELTAAAQAKANDMLSQQYWAHNAPDGTQPWVFMRQAGYDYQVAGENLARDFAGTDDMITAWMASPTHKANIVNGRYSDIGIAVIDGRLQGVETTLVVQMFGTQRQVAAAVPEAAETTQIAIVSEPTPAPTVVPEVAGDTEPDETPVPAELAQVDVLNSQTTTLTQASPNLVAQANPQVLPSMLVPQGTLEMPPLFTPLQLIKAFFLALIMMVLFTLVYDSMIIGNRGMLRLVGQNLAHFLFLAFVAFLVIFFKGGVIG